MRKHIWLLGLISMFVATAVAQWRGNPSFDGTSYPGARGSGVVRGQVSSDNPIVGSLTVELFSPQHAGAISTNLEPDGRFEFHGVAPGQYELKLTGAAGAVVYQELVFISGDNQNLSIQMPARPKVARSSEATVSIRQLHHKVPAEAQREFS